MNKYKIRRILEQGMKEITQDVSGMNLEHKFHMKYCSHLLESMVDRNIDPYYFLELLKKSLNKMEIYQRHLSLPVRPRLDEDMEDGVEYRPVRIEVTDGNLWIGMTADKPFGEFEEVNTGMQCRMAIINNKRFPSRISCDVINVKDI